MFTLRGSRSSQGGTAVPWYSDSQNPTAGWNLLKVVLEYRCNSKGKKTHEPPYHCTHSGTVFLFLKQSNVIGIDALTLSIKILSTLKQVITDR